MLFRRYTPSGPDSQCRQDEGFPARNYLPLRQLGIMGHRKSGFNGRLRGEGDAELQQIHRSDGGLGPHPGEARKQKVAELGSSISHATTSR